MNFPTFLPEDGNKPSFPDSLFTFLYFFKHTYNGHSSKVSGIERTLKVSFLRGAQVELQKQICLGRSSDTVVTGLVMI